MIDAKRKATRHFNLEKQILVEYPYSISQHKSNTTRRFRILWNQLTINESLATKLRRLRVTQQVEARLLTDGLSYRGRDSQGISAWQQVCNLHRRFFEEHLKEVRERKASWD